MTRDAVRRNAWIPFLGVAAVLATLYMLVPPFKGNSYVMFTLGLSPVVAIPLAVRLHRPEAKAPWYWFAAGFLLFWAGDLYTYTYPRLHRGTATPFPSLGDASYVAVYPVLMVGLLLLVRRRSARSTDRGFLDAAILSIGLAVPQWIALMAPDLHIAELSTLGKIVQVAYPFGDVILLSAALLLALDGGKRGVSFHFMFTAIVCLLATDFVYGLKLLDGTYDNQLWLDLGWMGFYVLWAAAALHPSMTIVDHGRPAKGLLTRWRLALLSVACLVAPVVEGLHHLHSRNWDMLVVTGASIVLFGFVVARMSGLVRVQERSTERERALSQVGAALVGAATHAEVTAVAVAATRELAGDDVRVELLGAEHTAAANDGAYGSPSLVLELPPHDGVASILVAAGPAVADRTVHNTLTALGSQIVLAFERAALSQELGRRQSEARFASLVQHSSDLITVLAPDATIAYQSPAIERVLGWTPEEVVGRRIDELVDKHDNSRLLRLIADGNEAPVAGSQTLECSLAHRDGGTRQFEVLFTNLTHDEHVGGIVLNSRDVSERKAFERQLAHQAFHDPVTGLPNRALFVERVRHALARSRREQRGIGIVFVDLDDFKIINDSLGHAAGDEVLNQVAQRLALSIRASDTAARFGGDEFAVLLEDIEGVQEAADAAERIMEAIAAPLTAAHKELAVRCSLGITIAAEDGSADADELIRDADAAMYIAKRDGKGGYRLFEPDMHEGVLQRLELRTDLQRALVSDQLELFYQPVIRLEDGTISGVEALLRWNHPERGMVGPDQFIPLAEETGLIVPIGRWVLREGCREGKRLLDGVPSDRPATLAINLSLKQLQNSDIVADVRDALEESGLAPERLTLEITESVLMADTDLAVQRLAELKALGIKLALDDFGTGYSSLSYLSKFPVDVLKMDRSFLREGASQQTTDLANAVVALGSTLSLEVVAEGIELPEQWETLRDLGCELGQGFYFARPMNAEAARAFLAEGRAGDATGVLSAGDDAP
ncbi:putative bifunctional diguanylate cyclase/phosphodiesterase [Conexibacter woesei]|uniref:putative bifunctional diguanylate cyclase/phosphodiesterase n=1 Tax=Conexibacter woesei TaxID=191495 RepID=UPI00042544F8|nr:EAL domain-containing protein [Conexibacter woesei]